MSAPAQKNSVFPPCRAPVSTSTCTAGSMRASSTAHRARASCRSCTCWRRCVQLQDITPSCFEAFTSVVAMRRLVPLHVESTPPKLSVARQLRPSGQLHRSPQGQISLDALPSCDHGGGLCRAETSSGFSASHQRPNCKARPVPPAQVLGMRRAARRTNASGGSTRMLAASRLPARPTVASTTPGSFRWAHGVRMRSAAAGYRAYACVRESGSTAVGCEPVPTTCAAPSLFGSDADTAAACACLSRAGHICRGNRHPCALRLRLIACFHIAPVTIHERAHALRSRLARPPRGLRRCRSARRPCVRRCAASVATARVSPRAASAFASAGKSSLPSSRRDIREEQGPEGELRACLTEP